MFLEDCQFKGTWRRYQENVLKEFDKHIKDKKINIVAAPGSGKTILGLEIVKRLNENVLILTPTITIRNQWVERFIEMYISNSERPNWISEDIYNINKFNVVTYQALHCALNKEKIENEAELEEEEEEKLELERIEYDLIQKLNENNVKTIVLDEAHHLRTEWWKSLKEVIRKMGDVKVVSLTATPPYDVEENEWKKYEEICGGIDAEISVPELVATKDLCPHQDYVVFSMVTPTENDDVMLIKQNIKTFVKSLKSNEKFVETLKANPIIKDWKANANYILSNNLYYTSIIVFLNYAEVKLDKELVKAIAKGKNIPPFTYKWCEIMLKNILFKDINSYSDNKDVIEEIKKNLTLLGCIENGKVILEDVSAVKKIMESSIAKMDSIEQIVKNEYNSLGEELRLVILADYVRKDYLECDIEKANKIGVIPIFRRLLQKNICSNIAVLTGTIKIIPKILVPILQEELKIMKINYQLSVQALSINANYALVSGNKMVENAIVKVITKCLEQGKINVIIGTVALLGEGWDAPAVNSLVLASFVGSFMLSNQMRGRAIRNSNLANKTANIWHLASLATTTTFEENGEAMDFTDYKILERRFNGFVGIAYYDDVIQNGMQRLENITPEALKKDYNKVNDETYRIARNRDQMVLHWRRVIEKFGGENIKIVNKLYTNKKINNKVFIEIDIVKMLILDMIVFFNGLILKNNIENNKIVLPIFLILGGLISIHYVSKIVKHSNQVKLIKSIGKVVLKSMQKCGKLTSNKLIVNNVVETTNIKDEKFFVTYLNGATVYENNIFVKSMKDVCSQINNTRYFICPRRKIKIFKDTYFDVPDMFDSNKNEAKTFLDVWNMDMPKGELIFSKSQKGKRIAFNARKNIFMQEKDKFFYRNEATRWKKE